MTQWFATGPLIQVLEGQKLRSVYPHKMYISVIIAGREVLTRDLGIYATGISADEQNISYITFGVVLIKWCILARPETD
jgi:hypothetical protein